MRRLRFQRHCISYKGAVRSVETMLVRPESNHFMFPSLSSVNPDH